MYPEGDNLCFAALWVVFLLLSEWWLPGPTTGPPSTLDPRIPLHSLLCWIHCLRAPMPPSSLLTPSV